MQRIFKKLIGFTVGMLFLALPQMGESEERQVFDLGEIVITATKTPHLLSSVPGTVTVISEADIESINPQDAGDLLENIAGIKTERYGGIGQAAGIHMRGLYATEVLVLVDARPINSPSLGSADLSWIPIDNIEQIEVVRGPNSALFGANAVGGVINIITKRPPEKFSTTLLSSYGSWNTFTEGIEMGGRYRDLGFLVTGNYKNSNGSRDNSDYESKSLSAKLEYKICDSQIVFSTEYYRDRVGLPGVRSAEDPGNRYQSQLVLGNDDVSSLFDYEKKERYSFNGVFERENLKIKGYFSDWNDYNHREWMEYFWPGYEHHCSQDSYDTKMYGIEPQYSLKLFDVNLITTGLSLEMDKFAAKTEDYNMDTSSLDITSWNAKRTTRALYLQDEIKIEPILVNLGVRWDSPSDYGSQVSPKAGFVWSITADMNLKLSYGEGFRAPSLNDLHWPEDPFSQGNPDLEPEKTKNYEVGIEKTFKDRVLLKVSVFRQKVEDRIAWTPTGPVGPYGNKWIPSNVNKVETDGIEVEAKAKVSQKCEFSLGYTYLGTVQKNMELIDDLTKQMEEVKRFTAYTPRHKIAFGLVYKDLFKIESLRLNFDVEYISKTYNYYSNYSAWPQVTMDTKKLSGYTVANLKLTKAFSFGEVFLAMDNIFDEKYAKFGGDINDRNYPMPGFSFTGGLKVEF